MRHCRDCKRFLPTDCFYAAPRRRDGLDPRCKPCRQARNKARREILSTPQERTAKVMEWRRKNVRRFGVYMKRWRRQQIKRAFTVLGNACTCCGEREFAFLQVDHIHGDGGLERRALKMNQQKLYERIATMDNPHEQYRLLCANCHFAHSYRGGCPHELRRGGQKVTPVSGRPRSSRDIVPEPSADRPPQSPQLSLL